MSPRIARNRTTPLAHTALALALGGAALVWAPLAASGEAGIDPADLSTTTSSVLPGDPVGQLPGDPPLLDQILPPAPSTTTTTAPSPSTTAPKPAATSTTSPGQSPPGPSTGGATGGSTSTGPLAGVFGPPPDGSSLPVATPLLVPDFDAALFDSGSLFGPEYTVSYGRRSTRDLVDLVARLGLGGGELVALLAPFPVAGSASYTDDWGAPRYGPGPVVRQHKGTDIFAQYGTPVIASSAGTVTRVGVRTAVGGNTVTVTAPDGTFYYYAHLDQHAEGLFEGQRVSAGQVLGYVGTTGNAQGTQPHLHYEIHPGGGAAVPPVPYLDNWLAEARASADLLAASSDPATVTLRDIVGDRTRVTVPKAAPTTLEGVVSSAAHSDQNPALSVAIVASLGAVVWWQRRRRQHLFAQLTTGPPADGGHRIDLRAVVGTHLYAPAPTADGVSAR